MIEHNDEKYYINDRADWRRDIPMEQTEINQVQSYLRTLFKNQDIALIHRPQASDSVEFEVNGECLGVVYRDDEDGETCYHVQLTVLKEDLS